MMTMLEEAVRWLVQAYRWCFAKRLTLDGGTKVYKGALLAEGGFSTVYAGRDETRQLALKLICCSEKEQQDMAMREIRAHKLVGSHKHVMPLIDCAVLQLEGRRFAVLAFPRMSRSLRQLIDSRVQPWRPAEIVSLLEGVALGLGAVHAAGLAHRDVKPENVLLDDSGRAVLMDLGSAAALRTTIKTRRDALMLQDEASSGSTMPYRAPELWEPNVPSVVDGAKTDIWSLGCLMWATALGYSPFESEITSSSKAPRIVETSYSRILAKPLPAPWDDLPTTRDHAAFYKRLDVLARSLFALDPAKRPSLNVALASIKNLIGDDDRA